MNAMPFGEHLVRFDTGLAEINARCAEWNERLERERKDLEAQGVGWWEALETVHKRSGEMIARGECPVDFDKLHALLDDLCGVYLKAEAAERSAIRATFDDKPHVLKYLHSYIGRTSRLLEETGHKRWLRSGLAAASIGDQRVDWRDLMIRLGDLYVTARRVGFRPGYQFRAVARISNPVGRHGDSSTRDLLANFRKSAHLRGLLEKAKRETTQT